MKTVGFSAGEVIFREGDAALAMYVIQKGSVGVWLDYDTEEKQQLSVLKNVQPLGQLVNDDAEGRIWFDGFQVFGFDVPADQQVPCLDFRIVEGA